MEKFNLTVITVDEETLIKTSDILSNLGSNDSVTSLINNRTSGSSERAYPGLYDAIVQRGKLENEGRSYWFSLEEFKVFISRYNPRGEEKKRLWEEFKDWAINVKLANNIVEDVKVQEKEKKEVKQNNPKIPYPISLRKAAKMMGLHPIKEFNHFFFKVRKSFERSRNGVIMPKQSEINRGYFVVEEVAVGENKQYLVHQTKITPKGYEFFRKKLAEHFAPLTNAQKFLIEKGLVIEGKGKDLFINGEHFKGTVQLSILLEEYKNK